MVYLVGQMLFCLVIAALIGGIIGWLLKQLRCRSLEQRLRHELEEKNRSLDAATGRAQSLEADLTEARRRLEAEKRRLESRVQELEPLTGIVRRREATIGRLKEALRSADVGRNARVTLPDGGNDAENTPPDVDNTSFGEVAPCPMVGEKTRGHSLNAEERTRVLATKSRNELIASPSGASDDLKKIRGIGPVMERILIDLGITTYRQIAEFNRQDIERVAAAIETSPNRIIRDDWVGGAKREYAKKRERVTTQTGR